MQKKEILSYTSKIQLHRFSILISLLLYIVYIALALLELNQSSKYQLHFLAGFFAGAGILMLIHLKYKVPPLPETHFLGVSIWRPLALILRSSGTLKAMVIMGLISMLMYLLRNNIDDNRLRFMGFLFLESIITSTLVVLFIKSKFRMINLLKLLLFAIVGGIAFWVPLSLDLIGGIFCAVLFLSLFLGINNSIVNPIYYGFFSDPYIIEKTSGQILGSGLSQFAIAGRDVIFDNLRTDEIEVDFDETWMFPQRSDFNKTYSQVCIVSLKLREGSVEVAFPLQFKAWFELQRELKPI